jgi:anti-sigma B factor antagonist
MTFERTDQDETVTLRIEGALDAVSTPELRPVIEEIVTERKKLVIVNLAGLRLIDSSGVAAIVSLYKRLRPHGGEVRVQGLRDQPLAIFKLLRLDRVFGLL